MTYLEYETYCNWYPKCPKHDEVLHGFAMVIENRMYTGYDCYGKVVRDPDKTVHYHCNYRLWEDQPPKVIKK
ncbi:MAG: hypothetical protein K0S93_172 [Nitrososphaeraceae archaeon]|jgi:hypothetical protein|nr:hypothetical protein [Nitrososphaeraceae archaeon]